MGINGGVAGGGYIGVEGSVLGVGWMLRREKRLRWFDCSGDVNIAFFGW